MSERPDLDALREKAEAATDGPWHYCPPEHVGGHELIPHDGPRICGFPFEHEYGEDEPPEFRFQREDGEFMAAANPATVLSLIDRVERLQAVLYERATTYYDESGVPEGYWCYLCDPGTGREPREPLDHSEDCLLYGYEPDTEADA